MTFKQAPKKGNGAFNNVYKLIRKINFRRSVGIIPYLNMDLLNRVDFIFYPTN